MLKSVTFGGVRKATKHDMKYSANEAQLGQIKAVSSSGHPLQDSWKAQLQEAALQGTGLVECGKCSPGLGALRGLRCLICTELMLLIRESIKTRLTNDCRVPQMSLQSNRY